MQWQGKDGGEGLSNTDPSLLKEPLPALSAIVAYDSKPTSTIDRTSAPDGPRAWLLWVVSDPALCWSVVVGAPLCCLSDASPFALAEVLCSPSVFFLWGNVSTVAITWCRARVCVRACVRK